VKRLRAIAGVVDVLVFVGALALIALATSILFALAMVAFWLALLIVLYRPEWLRDGVFALSIAAFGAGVLATNDGQAALRFYEATAQLVPVVFIALAVEIHAFRTDRPRSAEDLRPAAVIALALVYAEYEALRVLASGDAGSGEFNFVVGALAAAAVGIVLPALLGRRPDALVSAPATTVHPQTVSIPRSRHVPWPGVIALALLLIASRRRSR